ncbi:MAG: hypothetical protein MK160_08185 [Rhodobacteraceae bacterium]|nr:hypothetical protein [Paracoccaceae bacterium]
MTNSIALGLGLFIIAGIAMDYVVFGGDHLIFLGKKGFALIEWMAFWR